MEGDNRIRDRKFGRELAVEALGMAADQFPGASREMMVSFWEACASQADEELAKLGAAKPAPPSLVPMTNEECRKFENSAIPFGKHNGKRVGLLMRDEPGYLDWLCQATEADQFKDDLRRYLANPDIQEAMP